MIEDHIYLYETGTNKAEAQSWYIYIYENRVETRQRIIKDICKTWN